MDNLEDSFNAFFEDDDEGVVVHDKVEDFKLPDISLDTLDSGELNKVNLVDSDKEADVSYFFEPLPNVVESSSERISDDSGDFSSDYNTQIDGSNDSLVVNSIDDLLASFVDDSAESERSVDESYYDYYESEDDEDPLAGFDIDKILNDAIVVEASDVHIEPNQPVRFTILGSISMREEYPIPDGGVTQRVQLNILSNILESDFVENLELDTSYVIKKGEFAGRRLRLSMGKTFGNIFMVFRVISDVVPTPEELGVTPELLSWTDLPNGLLMVNGPTGTGKTTTLASLLKRIQLTRPQKIITLERPVEFIFGSEKMSLVTQREIGRDARSFSKALDSAMRQAPDIIMVGEVRNRVEVNELLRAAETGHLTVSTMHTNSAAATINRIKSLYEGDDQLRILASLSDVARGFANQVLVKSPDGKSRFAVREVLTVDDEVSRLILAGDVQAIRALQVKRGITLEHELVRAVAEGKCTADTARKQSSYPRLLEELLITKGLD